MARKFKFDPDCVEEKPRRAAAGAPYDHADAEPDLEPVDLVWLRPGNLLTPENVEKMRLKVASGVTIPVAAGAAGLGPVWKRWAKDAREHAQRGVPAGWGEGESPERFWLEAMKAAKCAYESMLLDIILAAAPKDWKAAAWLIERLAPTRYHLQAKLEVTAKTGEKLEVSSMSTEKLIALARGILPEAEVRAALPSGDPTDAELIEDVK